MRNNKVIKLAALVSHPIQYQAPLFREIAKQPNIDLKVFYLSDKSAKEYMDKDFGCNINWDVPLLEGYNYDFLSTNGSKNKIAFFRPLTFGLVERLKKENFDALWVHGYSNPNCIRAIIDCNKLGLKVFHRGDSNINIKTNHLIKKYVKNFLLNWLFKKCSGFLSVGSLNKAYYFHYGVPEEKIFEMPYSVDNIYIQNLIQLYKKNRDLFRNSLNLQPGRPVILYASKMIPRKRPMDLLKAYIQMAGLGNNEPKPYLIFVGDGQELIRLKKRAKETGWSSIKFLGFKNQSELPAYFDLCDVFVLPSQNEPWGLIVNEVMNAGKPIVVSDQVGCAPDLITHGSNGFIYPAGNINTLNITLRKLLDDPNLMEQMGAKSLEKISSWGFQEDIQGLRKALNL